MNDVLDYQAQHYLRSFIRDLPYEERKQLHNVSLCNQHVSRATGGDVYVLVNEELKRSRYYGLMRCKNTWCCPVCTALEMEKYRKYINAAIEMLCKTHFGFMVTLTIPHFKFMGWRETMDILYDTWKYFRLKSFNRDHGHVFHQFNQEVPTENWVRVGEFTWSEKNGAHPHFHCIWWTPRGNEGKVLDWESRLNDFWLKQARRIAIKYWRKHKLHEDLLNQGAWQTYEQLADTVFQSLKNNEQERGRSWNEAVHFSRDANGNLLEAKTGDYISGWGADNEVTGNCRKEASHSGHLTPYQILIKAQTDSRFRAIYMEFCLAVTRKPVHHRVNFSKNKLFARVKEWLKNQPKEESDRLEKKSVNKWAVVCYFSEEQWYDILDLEDMTGSPITSNILYLASQSKEILLEYLDGMKIGYQFPIKLPFVMQDWIAEAV